MATELKKVDMMDTKGDVILYVSVPINLGKLFRVIEEEPAIPVQWEEISSPAATRTSRKTLLR